MDKNPDESEYANVKNALRRLEGMPKEYHIEIYADGQMSDIFSGRSGKNDIAHDVEGWSVAEHEGLVELGAGENAIRNLSECLENSETDEDEAVRLLAEAKALVEKNPREKIIFDASSSYPEVVSRVELVDAWLDIHADIQLENDETEAEEMD